MIFEKLADGILKHSKAIIAIWVVLLICCVPMALKVGDVMSYDMNDMADENSESVQGLTIVAQYFPSSGVDTSSIPILVLHYEDEAGMAQAQQFIQYLNAAAATDPTWSGKLMSEPMAFYPMSPQGAEDGSGIIMLGVLYNPDVEVNAIDDTPELRAFVDDVMDEFEADYGNVEFSEYVTGMSAISFDMSDGSAKDLQRIEPFTILMILILIGLFFRSFITSATPPMTIGIAFVVVMGLMFLLGQVLNIFFFTQMLLLVTMMGAGCDYCIFIIARYREELRAGKSHHDSLREAIIWAGESIAISGAAVFIGFGSMAVCSYEMVSVMGICMALSIFVALIAALTFIPSMLNLVGDRIFWPTKTDAFMEGGKATRGWYAWCGNIASRYFERSSKFSIKHAKVIVLAAVLVTVPAAYVALESETSYDMISSMSSGDSGEGMDLITEYSNAGMLMPDWVILEFEQPVAYITTQDTPAGPVKVFSWVSDTAYKHVSEMGAQILSSDDNIAEVTTPFYWDAIVNETATSAQIDPVTNPTEVINAVIAGSNSTITSYLGPTIQGLRAQGMSDVEILFGAGPMIDYIVNHTAGTIGGENIDGDSSSVTYLRVSASTVAASMSATSMGSIQKISEEVDEYLIANPSSGIVESWVTGSAVVMYEVSETISDELGGIAVLVVVMILLLLFVVMRSYTIPFRSVLTILMSVVWTLAATHYVFVNVLGGEMMWMVPLMLIVICLGLGMDYDILLTTRIKENVTDKGMSNDDAIRHAVVHTGSIITICGLIMAGAFGTLMLSSMEMMQEFGFALCFAILVDALLVRTYIVPAMMHLLGNWNWRGPGRKITDKGSE